MNWQDLSQSEQDSFNRVVDDPFIKFMSLAYKGCCTGERMKLGELGFHLQSTHGVPWEIMKIIIFT